MRSFIHGKIRKRLLLTKLGSAARLADSSQPTNISQGPSLYATEQKLFAPTTLLPSVIKYFTQLPIKLHILR
jgi:hypothetical protein